MIRGSFGNLNFPCPDTNMKRVVSSSIITLFIIIAVLVTYFYLRNFKSAGGDPVNAVPSDAAFVMVIEPSIFELKEFSKASYWKLLRKAPAFNELVNHINVIDTLIGSNEDFNSFYSANPWYISAHVTGAGSFDFLLLKSTGEGQSDQTISTLMKQLVGEDNQIQERNYDGITINEISLSDNRQFSYAISKGIYISSFTPFLVEDALRQLKVGKPLTKNFEEMEQEVTPTGLKLFVNFNNLPAFTNIFLDSKAATGANFLKRFCSWSGTGMEFTGKNIGFSGFLYTDDSLQLMNCFAGQQPAETKLLQILTRKTAMVTYFGLSDFNLFYDRYWKQYASQPQQQSRQKVIRSITENYKLKIEEKMLEWIGNEFAMVITEPSGINFDNNCYAVVKARKTEAAKNSLKTISRIVNTKTKSKTMEETYNGHVIGHIGLTGVLPAILGESFTRVTKMYYTNIGEYFIFGNQASAIRLFIDEYKSGSLMAKSVSEKLPASGNLFFHLNPAQSFYLMKSVFNREWKGNLENYKSVFSGLSEFSFIMTLTEGAFKFTSRLNFAGEKNKAGVSQSFVVDTDSSVYMRPLITTDPITNGRQILFQDEAENLYLVDNSGSIVWKQSIDGKLMSDIFEMDLFKNNSRQFLFNTRDYLYLLDVEGKPVGNYPIRLPSPATNGLAVLTFDNKKDPKIYIACDNRRVYAYLPSGKPLPGWNFQQNTGTVTNPAKAIQLGGKHYLLIYDLQGGVSIVNKFGESGISLIHGFTVAQNSDFYKDPSGSLVTTDTAGNVMMVSADGLVQSIPLNAAGADHGFVYSDADNDGDPDYIFLEGRELIAYDKSLTLIYRKEFETPLDGRLQLVELKDGIKAMVAHSTAANKTWLLKMEGTIYEGFPVKGSGTALIDEINMDGRKNLFTGSSENSFYMYSID